MKKKSLAAVFAIAGLMLTACSSGNDGNDAPTPVESEASHSSQEPANEATVQPSSATQHPEEIRECVESTAAAYWQTAGMKGHPSDWFDDPEIVELCKGLNEEVEFPSYTPDANNADEECMRKWAEDNTDMFPEGMSVEEIMEDPMAAFSCE
ncbi:hypothetical protein [Glutamicibacter creatinolyticus]|uniref:hypothetical protein n=1 Tax=Glutamicibacter creatinolyticus TaxID=162496 RepID=UPI0031DBAB81